MQEALKDHLVITMKLVKYLKLNPGQGMFFIIQKILKLQYTMMQIGVHVKAHRSTSGYYMFLGKSLMS